MILGAEIVIVDIRSGFDVLQNASVLACSIDVTSTVRSGWQRRWERSVACDGRVAGSAGIVVVVPGKRAPQVRYLVAARSANAALRSS